MFKCCKGYNHRVNCKASVWDASFPKIDHVPASPAIPPTSEDATFAQGIPSCIPVANLENRKSMNREGNMVLDRLQTVSYVKDRFASTPKLLQSIQH